MKLKTRELTSAALDWAVAKCIGHVDSGRVVIDLRYLSGEDPVRWEPQLSTYYSSAYAPSTDWAQGGPIVEREEIALEHMPFDKEWEARLYPTDGTPWVLTGPTPLIAAMRCFVASRLGDEVNIPEELKGESE